MVISLTLSERMDAHKYAQTEMNDKECAALIEQGNDHATISAHMMNTHRGDYSPEYNPDHNYMSIQVQNDITFWVQSFESRTEAVALFTNWEDLSCGWMPLLFVNLKYATQYHIRLSAQIV